MPVAGVGAQSCSVGCRRPPAPTARPAVAASAAAAAPAGPAPPGRTHRARPPSARPHARLPLRRGFPLPQSALPAGASRAPPPISRFQARHSAQAAGVFLEHGASSRPSGDSSPPHSAPAYFSSSRQTRCGLRGPARRTPCASKAPPKWRCGGDTESRIARFRACAQAATSGCRQGHRAPRPLAACKTGSRPPPAKAQLSAWIQQLEQGSKQQRRADRPACLQVQWPGRGGRQGLGREIAAADVLRAAGAQQLLQAAGQLGRRLRPE